MKTQISRDSFQPGQRYSGVYLQQGRMILDADWNELTDIEKARLVDALRDVIAGGAPRVGGLKIYADPDGSTNIRIQPGALYVEGVPACLDAAASLAVNAQPDYPIQADYSGQSLRLYADVWERSVSALEQSDLLDAALHGADTATRSQTLLQVKWCANGMDPLNPAANPPQGDAPLSLKLRLIASGGDACDPCASQVKVDERIGNYLFRVEVHDYDPSTQWLTLKWSRDNGAEACAVAAMPRGFNQGDWIWEYFDSDTERLLGNHFAPNPLKLRGLIKETCATPTGANEPKTWVRQWDGYIRIKLNSGTLSGRDRGVALFTDVVGNQAQGRANFSGGVLKLNLERMELELSTSGKRFVPGDYWLAEVREAEDDSGDTVLAAALPRGVRHHYLFLGELGVNKKLVAQDDAFRRRMAFPPITDITATDVSYVVPAVTGLIDSVRSRLPSIKGLHDGDRITLQAALDCLLREMDARSIPYRTDGVGGSAVSIADLMVKKTGDTMTGALTITPSPALPATSAALTVNGKLMLQAEQTTPDKAILSYDKPTGFAKWIETSLAAWQLSNGNLSTVPGSVTGSITIGSPETESLYISASGRIGIGTSDPQAPLHLVTHTSDTNKDDPAYGMKWLWGQHIADGATKMWNLSDVYGRLVTWDSDCMFVGLKNEGTDRKDAVIAWGDNTDDCLRFLFAGYGDPPPAPAEYLKITGEGGIFVPHAAVGTPNSRSLEVGSQVPVTAGTPNGRIGFPGYTQRHGQLRWVPDAGPKARFEFIDASSKSPSGDYGANAGLVSIKALDAIITGSIHCDGFKATPIFNYRQGPLPISATFTKGNGRTLVVFATGSAFSTIAGRTMTLQVTIDGMVMGQALLFANEANSHKAFPAIFSVVTTSISSGVHTFGFQLHESQLPLALRTDSNDYFSATIIELPF